MNVQWFPGHMTKALRMMREDIRLVDLVIELADARIPRAARNPELDELGRGKARLIILNKADLAEASVTELWLEEMGREGIALAVDSRDRGDMEGVRRAISQACRERIERDKKRGIVGRRLRAMVVGIPNVGKSTFINSLAGKASARTGNKPGVTRGKQWISLGDGAQLLDTPGVLWPRFDDEATGRDLAIIGSVNDDNLDMGELSAQLIALMDELYPGVIEERYGLTAAAGAGDEDWPRAAALLMQIARSKSLLRSGAVPDTDRAAALLIDDLRSGRLGRVSLERP